MEEVKPGRATLRKDERLSSRKTIGYLMKEGTGISAHPLKLIFQIQAMHTKAPAQVTFAVPKKNFRLAVDRNRIKRQLREVYRKNKNHFYTLLKKRNLQAALMIIFTGNIKPEYGVLEKKFNQIILKFEEHIIKTP